MTIIAGLKVDHEETNVNDNNNNNNMAAATTGKMEQEQRPRRGGGEEEGGGGQHDKGRHSGSTGADHNQGGKQQQQQQNIASSLPVMAAAARKKKYSHHNHHHHHSRHHRHRNKQQQQQQVVDGDGKVMIADNTLPGSPPTSKREASSPKTKTPSPSPSSHHHHKRYPYDRQYRHELVALGSVPADVVALSKHHCSSSVSSSSRSAKAVASGGMMNNGAATATTNTTLPVISTVLEEGENKVIFTFPSFAATSSSSDGGEKEKMDGGTIGNGGKQRRALWPSVVVVPPSQAVPSTAAAGGEEEEEKEPVVAKQTPTANNDNNNNNDTIQNKNNSTNDHTENGCVVSIDVDGPYVAIKDMRKPFVQQQRSSTNTSVHSPSSSSSEEKDKDDTMESPPQDRLEIFLSRRIRKCELIAAGGRIVVGGVVVSSSSAGRNKVVGSSPVATLPVGGGGGSGGRMGGVGNSGEMEIMRGVIEGNTSRINTSTTNPSTKTKKTPSPHNNNSNNTAEEEEEGGYDTNDENDEADENDKTRQTASARLKQFRQEELEREEEGYHPLEPLPRRQMRILHKGDRVVIRMLPDGIGRRRRRGKKSPSSRAAAAASAMYIAPMIMKFEYRAKRIGVPEMNSNAVGVVGVGVGDEVAAAAAAAEMNKRGGIATPGKEGGVMNMDGKGTAERDADTAAGEAAVGRSKDKASSKIHHPRKEEDGDDSSTSTTDAAVKRVMASSFSMQDVNASGGTTTKSSDGVSTNAAVVAAANKAAAAVVAAVKSAAIAKEEAEAATTGNVLPSSSLRHQSSSPPNNANVEGGAGAVVGGPAAAAAAAGAGANNDDDDEMEEYSYLTGEVIMKDQGYVSAITGDEETDMDTEKSKKNRMSARSKHAYELAVIGGPGQAGTGLHGMEVSTRRPRALEIEEDAATASAVVLGATSGVKSPGVGVVLPTTNAMELNRNAQAARGGGKDNIGCLGEGDREKKVSIKSDYEDIGDNYVFTNENVPGVGMKEAKAIGNDKKQTTAVTAKTNMEGGDKGGIEEIDLGEDRKQTKSLHDDVHEPGDTGVIFFTAEEEHDDSEKANETNSEHSNLAKKASGDFKSDSSSTVGQNDGTPNGAENVNKDGAVAKPFGGKTTTLSETSQNIGTPVASNFVASPVAAEEKSVGEESEGDETNDFDVPPTQALETPMDADVDGNLLSQSSSCEETETVPGDTGGDMYEEPTQPLPRSSVLTPLKEAEEENRNSDERSAEESDNDEVFNSPTQPQLQQPRSGKIAPPISQMENVEDADSNRPEGKEVPANGNSSISSVSCCALADGTEEDFGKITVEVPYPRERRSRQKRSQYGRKGVPLSSVPSRKGQNEIKLNEAKLSAKITQNADLSSDQEGSVAQDDACDPSKPDYVNASKAAILPPETAAHAEYNSKVESINGKSASTPQLATTQDAKKGDEKMPSAPSASAAIGTPPGEWNRRRDRAVRRDKNSPTSPNAYIMASLQNQGGGNGVVHRVSSGAIMTGPVGTERMEFKMDIMSKRSPRPPPVRMDQLPLRMMEKDLLTSIALLSNERSRNISQPAASSEETTVCQMSASEFAKDMGSTTYYAKGDSASVAEDRPPLVVELPGKEDSKASSHSKLKSSASRERKDDKEPPTPQPSPRTRSSGSPRVSTNKKTGLEDAINGLNSAKSKDNAIEHDQKIVPDGIPSEIIMGGRSSDRQRRLTRRSTCSSKDLSANASPSKKRKRGETGVLANTVNSCENDGADSGKIRVIITGVQVTSRHRKMIDSIGATLVESIDDACTATHVIAGDGKTPLRRTPKLMICLCHTSNILHMNWLTQSSKARRPLDCNDYLLLDDKGAETTYNFSMRQTLKNIDTIRKNGRRLFTGWSIYICKGVAGNKAPPLHELHLIITAADGNLLKSLTSSNLKRLDSSKLISITSDPPTTAQKAELDAVNVTTLGGRQQTTSWLFHCMITQHLDGLDDVHVEIENAKMSSVSPNESRRKKRKSSARSTPPDMVPRRTRRRK